MSGLELFVAIAGVVVTALVVVGMILITPLEVDQGAESPERDAASTNGVSAASRREKSQNSLARR